MYPPPPGPQPPPPFNPPRSGGGAHPVAVAMLTVFVLFVLVWLWAVLT